ncbi:amidohydrolase family protein [Pseudalkalibacillus sp. A8]|uniref:metal-dependent hydrolase family protein n=1 Tax=Pseudalkalibacillus sp. A8 TaxID=3382641 RepID=UPI0038B6AF98
MANQVLLKGGLLIDGNGGGVIENAGVLNHGERITAVGPVDLIPVPENVEIVDVEGKVIMPGLVDAHVHLIGVKNLNLMLAVLEPTEIQMGRALKDLPKLIDAGVTAIRDVGSPVALHIRNLIKDGVYEGPRVKTSYKILGQTGGHGDIHMLPPEFNMNRTCDGVDDCRKAAREQFRAGADFIKICSSGGVLSEKDDPRSPQLTVEEISAIVYEAEAVGSYVASHAQSTQGIINALKAGVKTIEHGILIDEEGIELMLENEAYLVPTLAIVKRIVDVGDQYGVPEFGLRKARTYYDLHIQNMKKAYAAGVKIAAGTDFAGCDPVAHGGNALELELLVNDVGVTPMEAIVSGTKTSAEAIGLGDEIGTIEKGKLADLIIVDGNPAEDISVLLDTNNIKQVYVGGKRYKNGEAVKKEVELI